MGEGPRHVAGPGSVAGDLDGNRVDDLVADLSTNGVFVRYNNQAPWRNISHYWNQRACGRKILDGNGKQELLLALPSGGLLGHGKQQHEPAVQNPHRHPEGHDHR